MSDAQPRENSGAGAPLWSFAVTSATIRVGVGVSSVEIVQLAESVESSAETHRCHGRPHPCDGARSGMDIAPEMVVLEDGMEQVRE